MKYRSRQSGIAVTVVAAGLCIACAANAGDTGMRDRDSSGAPASGDAMRAYIDPATGKPGVPPPGTVFAPAQRAVPALADEVPNAGPAGGYMLDTRGLVSEFRQTIGPDGKPVVECHPATAAPATEE